MGRTSAGDWLTYNGHDSGNRYSPLRQVQTSNVYSLKLKWVFPIISYFGLENHTSRLMACTSPVRTKSMPPDALTGNPLWHYSRPASAGIFGDARLGTNRWRGHPPP